MNRKLLYVVAAVIWGIPGIIITSKGISAYGMQPSDKLWWLLLITAVVLTAFFFMFRRIVTRYCCRIASLQDKVKIWQTFPIKGWILLVFMMILLLRTRTYASFILRKISATYQNYVKRLYLLSFQPMSSNISGNIIHLSHLPAGVDSAMSIITEK